jgi:hypothetical protein
MEERGSIAMLLSRTREVGKKATHRADMIVSYSYLEDYGCQVSPL